MVSQKDLYKSLRTMIEWTKQFQLSASREFKGTISVKAWAKEYCTIKFCLPRGSGHTVFAKKLIKKVFSQAIYLAPSYNIITNAGFSLGQPFIGISSSVQSGKFRGTKADVIIIDCTSLMSSKDIEMIYDEFLPMIQMVPTFIFLFLE